MDYFILKRDNNKILYKKSGDYIKNKKIFKKYSDMSIIIKKKKFLTDIFYRFPTKIIFTMLNNKNTASLEILNNCKDIYYKLHNMDINFYNREIKKFKKGDDKFDNVIGTGLSEKIYKNVKNWDKKKFCIKI